MTRSSVLTLFNGLMSVSKLTGAKFTYAVARNISALKETVIALGKAEELTKEMVDFENKRMELIQEFGVKEDGVLKTEMVGGRAEYALTDREAFKKRYEKLKKDNLGILEKREKQMQEVDKLLSEEIEVDLHMIKEEYLPEEISTKQMMAILPIVEKE